MTDEKPPPTARAWESGWRWILLASSLIGVLAGLFGGLILSRLLGWPESTDAKVAAYGAWVSAIGAFFLGTVSVWMAWRAEARAKEEVKAAELRHKNELAAANQRVLDQVNVQWRRDQLALVAQAYKTYNGFLYESMRFIESAKTKVQRRISEQDAQLIAERYRSWATSRNEVQNTYAAANLVVSDRPTREALMECDEFAANLAKHIYGIHAKVSSRRNLSSKEIEDARSAHESLLLWEENLLNTARDNLNAPASVKPESNALRRIDE